MLNINLIKTVSIYTNNKNLTKILLLLPYSRIFEDDLYMEILNFKQYYLMHEHFLITNDILDGLKCKMKYIYYDCENSNIIYLICKFDKLRMLKYFMKNIVFKKMYLVDILNGVSDGSYDNIGILKWTFNNFPEHINTYTAFVDYIYYVLSEQRYHIGKFLIKYCNSNNKNIIRCKYFISNYIFFQKKLNFVKFIFKNLGSEKNSLKYWINILAFHSIDVLLYIVKKIPNLFDNVNISYRLYNSNPYSKNVLQYMIENKICNIEYDRTFFIKKHQKKLSRNKKSHHKRR